MKDFLIAFRSDFKGFLRSNWKVLIICLITVFVIQFLEKGNSLINLSVITLHIVGDVFMILSLTKYAHKENKTAVIYMFSSSIVFLTIGFIAILQSPEGKNWQYFLGTIPFFVANIYQLLDAWEMKGKKIFNYKLTIFVTLSIAFLYYYKDLVYNHTWLQIFGYSLFPIFLGMKDSPKVYIARISSVFIMLFGVLIDLKFQFITQSIIPASAISSFFITLIAFFGFISNASMYVERPENNSYFTKTLLMILVKIEKST